MVDQYIIKDGKLYGIIFTPYITKNGRKIFRDNKRRPFRLEIPAEKLRTA